MSEQPRTEETAAAKPLTTEQHVFDGSERADQPALAPIADKAKLPGPVAVSNTTKTADRWDKDVPLPDARSNRPVRFIHHVEAAVMGALMGICRAQRINRAAAMMGGLVQFIGPLLRGVHSRGHRNLRLVYPDMTSAERSAILRGTWWNIGAVAAEFAHLDQLAERTTIINAERLAPYTRAGGQQAIFFSGHFANWEAMACALHTADIPYAVVYRAANNPIIDAEIINRRAAAMSRWQIPKGRRGARDLLAALKSGVSLCIMGDQKFNDGVAVPFMGFPAMTATAAARLSIREGYPLVPLHLVRRPGSRFEMIVHDPIAFEESGDTSADVTAVVTRMNEILGQMVYERPEQWLWLHRRWPKRIAG